MMGTNHLASGLLAGLLAAKLGGLGVAQTAPVVAIFTLSADLPDLDSRRAFIVRFLGPLGLALHAVLTRLSVACGLPEHRGLTHTGLFNLGLSVLAFVPVVSGQLPAWWAVAFAGGLWVHLLGDAQTVSPTGIPLLWWPGRSVEESAFHLIPHFPRFRVNGGFEWLVLCPSINGASLLVLVWPYHEQFLRAVG